MHRETRRLSITLNSVVAGHQLSVWRAYKTKQDKIKTRLSCARWLLNSQDRGAHTRRHAQARALAAGGIVESLRPLTLALAPCSGVQLQLFSCCFGANETRGSNARKGCTHVRPRPQQQSGRTAVSMHAASSPRAVHCARACGAAPGPLRPRVRRHACVYSCKRTKEQALTGHWRETDSTKPAVAGLVDVNEVRRKHLLVLPAVFLRGSRASGHTRRAPH